MSDAPDSPRFAVLLEACPSKGSGSPGTTRGQGQNLGVLPQPGHTGR